MATWCVAVKEKKTVCAHYLTLLNQNIKLRPILLTIVCFHHLIHWIWHFSCYVSKNSRGDYVIPLDHRLFFIRFNVASSVWQKRRYKLTMNLLNCICVGISKPKKNTHTTQPKNFHSLAFPLKFTTTYKDITSSRVNGAKHNLEFTYTGTGTETETNTRVTLLHDLSIKMSRTIVRNIVANNIHSLVLVQYIRR